MWMSLPSESTGGSKNTCKQGGRTRGVGWQRCWSPAAGPHCSRAPQQRHAAAAARDTRDQQQACNHKPGQQERGSRPQVPAPQSHRRPPRTLTVSLRSSPPSRSGMLTKRPRRPTLPGMKPSSRNSTYTRGGGDVGRVCDVVGWFGDGCREMCCRAAGPGSTAAWAGGQEARRATAPHTPCTAGMAALQENQETCNRTLFVTMSGWRTL